MRLNTVALILIAKMKSNNSISESLAKLDSLLQSGILTQEEYKASRERILSQKDTRQKDLLHLYKSGYFTEEEYHAALEKMAKDTPSEGKGAEPRLSFRSPKVFIPIIAAGIVIVALILIFIISPSHQDGTEPESDTASMVEDTLRCDSIPTDSETQVDYIEMYRNYFRYENQLFFDCSELCAVHLIYLDNDDIPELIAEVCGCVGMFHIIFSIRNNKVVEISRIEQMTDYIPKSGLFNDYWENQYAQQEDIERISTKRFVNGEIIELTYCELKNPEREKTIGEDGHEGVYYHNGVVCDKETYYRVIEEEKRKYWNTSQSRKINEGIEFSKFIQL